MAPTQNSVIVESAICAIAGWVAGTGADDVPAETLDAARLCLLDSVAAAAGGFGVASAVAQRDWALREFAAGDAGVWFSGATRRASAAAHANSAAAAVLDADDGHREAAGHPGAGIVPAAVAVAEEVGASGRELLAAIAIGYEVGLRVACAGGVARRGVAAMMTGHWCGYGAAAATGRLRRMPAAQLAQALAVAGALRPVVLAPGASVNPNGIKEGIPWATLSGVAAVELASGGMTGPLHALDRLDRDRLLGDLGAGYLIDGVYRKPYACCQWFHPAIDALLDVVEAHALRPDEISTIRVATFANVLSMDNSIAPLSLEAAAYSLPFCVAVAVAEGETGLLPLRTELLARRDLLAIGERVTLVCEQQFERSFPAARRARVTLETTRGVFECGVDASRGVPENPMSESDLVRKLRLLARNSVPSRLERLIAAARDVEADAGDFYNAVREPLLA